jgi:hypothetical protein
MIEGDQKTMTHAARLIFIVYLCILHLVRCWKVGGGNLMLGDLDGESLGKAAGGMDGTPRRVDRRKGSDDSRRDWEAWMEGLGGESLGEAVGGLNFK